MKKPLLYICDVFVLLLLIINVKAQAPNISYSPSTVVLSTNIPFSVSPVNTGGAVPATVYGTVSTFAGSTAGLSGLTNGTGTGSLFNLPRSISIDASGNQYICDAGNNEIRKITSAGVTTLLAGNASGTPGMANGTGTAASFNLPYNSTADASGNLYIADFSNNQIRKLVIATGAVTLLAGNAIGTAGIANGTGTAASFNNPPGIVYNPADGNLYVTDFNNNQIRRVTTAGVVTLFAGSTTGASGTATGTGTAARFTGPNGIAVDAAGNLYVADQNNNQIKKITLAGVVTLVAGSPTAATGSADGVSTAATFSAPRGITVDASGNLFITDSNNNTIRLITPSGLVTTFAGTAGVGGYTDAVGTAALFNFPRGLDFDPSTGNLYVADYTNNVIRKIITTGYLISAPLPTGLTFDNKTGIISGTSTTTFGATTYTVFAFNASGSSSTTITISCTAPTINNWTGATSSNWSTPGNWSTGAVPSSTQTVEIGVAAYTGVKAQPSFSSSATVKAIVFGTNNTPTLTIASGQTLTVTNGITVNASANAVVNGPGTISVGNASTINATGSLTASSNLIISIASGGSINNLGTFTLASSASGSSSIAAIPSGSYITGNVTVQRYMTGGSLTYRGYRLLSSPVYTANVSGNNVYSINYIGVGSFLTGTDGTSGGFNKGGNPTLYLYRENFTGTGATFTSGNFRGIQNINQSPAYNYLVDVDGGPYNIPVGNGVLFFFRGASTTVNPYVTTTIPVAATLSTTGLLNQGQITVADWFTPASPTLSYTAASPATIKGYNLVGNPYPSTINWDTFQTGSTTTGIYGSSVSNKIYVLDPITKTYGSYIAGFGGVGSATFATNVIASGQGFFVVTTATGAKLIFNETAKTAAQPTGPTLLLGAPVNTQTNRYLRLEMGQSATINDQTLIRFDNQATLAYDTNIDAEYKDGYGRVSLSTKSSDNVNLSIYTVPLPKQTAIKIKLNVNAGADGAYNMALTDIVAVPQLYDVWLMDAYKKDSVNLRLTNSYTFNITNADTATFGNRRFSLVIRQNPALAYQLLTFTANKTSTPHQVNVAWTTKNEGNYTNFTVERSNDNGQTFGILYSVSGADLGAYSFLDKTPSTFGTNLYRLGQQDINNTITYSTIIPIQFSDSGNKLNNNVSIYPNPAGSTISLSVITIPTQTTNYNFKIINSSGVIVKEFILSQPLWQGNIGDLRPGTYLVRIVDNNTKAFVGENKFVKL